MNGIKVSEPLARKGPMRGGMAAACLLSRYFPYRFIRRNVDHSAT